MGKILDLTVFVEETLDIKMPDGATLHIPKPSQAMVIKTLRLNKILAGKEPEEQLEALNGMVMDVLNSNNGGKRYELAYVADMSLGMKSAIINAYSAFIGELQSDPN